MERQTTGREGGVLILVLVAVLAVACIVLWKRVQAAENAREQAAEEAEPAPASVGRYITDCCGLQPPPCPLLIIADYHCLPDCLFFY